MTVLQYWEEQREQLAGHLSQQTQPADLIYTLQHALAQTEQNALAAQTDDVLRQQMGVLFGVVKSSLRLLDVSFTSTPWVAQSRKREKNGAGKVSLIALTAGLMLLTGLLCYWKGLALGWIASLCALISGCATLMQESKKRKKADAAEGEQVRFTLRPDAEKLLSVLDGQMRSIDRCINDFAYLNDGLRGEAQKPGGTMVSRIAELLEALYEYDRDVREPAEEPVRQMLRDMGLQALDYSEESRRLFTTLPSKNETRTLAPAIVSTEDLRLLRRGTAAVKSDAA